MYRAIEAAANTYTVPISADLFRLSNGMAAPLLPLLLPDFLAYPEARDALVGVERARLLGVQRHARVGLHARAAVHAGVLRGLDLVGVPEEEEEENKGWMRGDLDGGGICDERTSTRARELGSKPN